MVSNGPGCPHTGADDSARIDTIADWIAGVVGRRNLDRAAQPSRSPSARAAATAQPSPAARRPDAGVDGRPAGMGAIAWSVASGVAVAGIGILVARRRRRNAYAARGIRRHARRR